MAGFEHLRKKNMGPFFMGNHQTHWEIFHCRPSAGGYVPTPMAIIYARQLSGLQPYNQSGQASYHAALQIGIPVSELGPATSFNHCKPKE